MLDAHYNLIDSMWSTKTGLEHVDNLVELEKIITIDVKIV